MSGEQLLTLVLLLPILGSVLVFLSGYLWEKAPRILALLIALGATAAGLALIPIVARDGYVALNLRWLELLGAGIVLRADRLSLGVLLTMAGIGSLAIAYCFGYYRGKQHPASFYALITLFLGAMIGTAVAANTILFYLFWEMMLVPSYALLALWGEGKYAARSAFKYFVFTHVGAVAILAAILWIYSSKGVTDITAIGSAIAGLPAATLTALAGLFIFGFAVKMGIFPLHSWMPGTYDDAPLPVTVMISGAMISAGIYGMIRFPFGLFTQDILTRFRLPLLIFAVVTQFYGAIMALTAKRIRRILAYSSISQMGYVLLGIATLSGLGLGGAMFHLVNHGLIKALLFMVAGAVTLRTAREKTSELGGLARNMPVTAWGCLIGALAIAGSPPLNGFQSEWMLLGSGFATPYRALAVVSLVASVFSAGYALLLIKRIFFGERSPGTEETREASGWMLAPMIVLTAGILLIGILPGQFLSWIDAALKTFGFHL